MPGSLIQLETQGIETQLLFNPTIWSLWHTHRANRASYAWHSGVRVVFLSIGPPTWTLETWNSLAGYSWTFHHVCCWYQLVPQWERAWRTNLMRHATISFSRPSVKCRILCISFLLAGWRPAVANFWNRFYRPCFLVIISYPIFRISWLRLSTGVILIALQSNSKENNVFL